MRGWIDDLTSRDDFTHAVDKDDLGQARTLAAASAYRWWPESAEIPSYVLGHLSAIGAEVKW